MPSPLHFAIIGCGVISSTHARALAELPGAQLSAVCDVIEARASTLSAGYAAFQPLIPTTPQVYSDYHALLARPDIDVVDICTPSGTHAEIGIAAAQAGKHVIVEKPIDVTLRKARALVEACHKAGVKLSVISQHRFDPAVVALKEAVDAGKLGQLNFGGSHTKWYRSQEYYDSGQWRGTWSMDGGGALINQSIHYVDLLVYIMGSVAELSAYTATRAHQHLEVEDIAVASVRFASGALGLIEGNTAAYPGFEARLDIYGSEGSVIVVNDRVAEWRLRSGEDCAVQDDTASTFIGGTSSLDIWHLAHRRQLADVINAITQDRAPLVSGEDAYRALQVVLAVYQSAREGKPIRL